MVTRQPGDTVHTVQIKNPPSATLRFIVGVAILYAVWNQRALVAGWIFRSFRGESPEGMESITGIVLPLAIDAIIAVGGFGVFIATFGWGIFADIVSGIYATIANWSTKQQIAARVADAVGAASRAATSAAGIGAGAGATAAGIIAAGSATDLPPPESHGMDLSAFMAAVQSTLREQRDAIAELRDTLETRPPVVGSIAPSATPPRRGRPKQSPPPTKPATNETNGGAA